MKKILLSALMAASSIAAMASQNNPGNWVVGIGYTNLSDEQDDLDVSIDMVVGSLGYKIPAAGNFYFIPEVRFGVGVTDDTITVIGVDVDVELDSFLAFSLRGQFDWDNGVYLFAAPAYANLEFTVSTAAGGVSASVTEDSWEFGFGGGIGYKFSHYFATEFSYEQFDGADMLSLGVKFSF